MPLIPTQNQQVKTYRGLHLFHFGMSNCSQRVRMCLEEKALPWTSHHIDLARNEHLTPLYQSIHPHSVVPALVHDGQVIIESIDIIEYLDRTFPEPALAAQDQAAFSALAALAKDRQTEIKLLTHEYLFKAVRRVGEGEIKALQASPSNPALADFIVRFKQGFRVEEVQGATDLMHAALAVLADRLAAAPWLAGDRFSLADIAWAVNVHRLEMMKFPIAMYPKVAMWLRRLEQRPSYQKALIQWEPRLVRSFFGVYSRYRRLTGRQHLMPSSAPTAASRARA